MGSEQYRRTLIQNLKAIRKSKGLTTVELAKILGVSQAKISYIENEKGVLSAEDIAILSRKLDVPITDFFRGLDKSEEKSETQVIASHLVHYGAALIARPSKVRLSYLPYEEVFAQSLSLIEDSRLHKAFCAALIAQASSREINVDRIFAIIGDNPFLTRKAGEQAELCLKIIRSLNQSKKRISKRASLQVEKIVHFSLEVLGSHKLEGLGGVSEEELPVYAKFVEDCLSD